MTPISRPPSSTAPVGELLLLHGHGAFSRLALQVVLSRGLVGGRFFARGLLHFEVDTLATHRRWWGRTQQLRRIGQVADPSGAMRSACLHLAGHPERPCRSLDRHVHEMEHGRHVQTIGGATEDWRHPRTNWHRGLDASGTAALGPLWRFGQPGGRGWRLASSASPAPIGSPAGCSDQAPSQLALRRPRAAAPSPPAWLRRPVLDPPKFARSRQTLAKFGRDRPELALHCSSSFCFCLCSSAAAALLHACPRGNGPLLSKDKNSPTLPRWSLVALSRASLASRAGARTAACGAEVPDVVLALRHDRLDEALGRPARRLRQARAWGRRQRCDVEHTQGLLGRLIS